VLDGGLTLRGRIVGASVDPTACMVRCESFSGNEVLYMNDARPDAQGVFEFTGLPDAALRLEVLAASVYFFPLAVVEDAHPGPGETVIEVDAARWPSVRLKGRVLDAQGVPVPGASVAPSLQDPAARNSPLLTTDASGAFDLGPYPPGRWTISIEHGRSGELRSAIVELGPGETWDFGDLILPQ
jgi:hypothetical protein